MSVIQSFKGGCHGKKMMIKINNKTIWLPWFQVNACHDILKNICPLLTTFGFFQLKKKKSQMATMFIKSG
jgi:hypothetical protein